MSDTRDERSDDKKRRRLGKTGKSGEEEEGATVTVTAEVVVGSDAPAGTASEASNIQNDAKADTAADNVQSPASPSAPVKLTRSEKWDLNFNNLIHYIAEFGTAKVPQSCNTPRYPKLGKWVSRQRDAYRNEQRRAQGIDPKRSERLSRMQIARLEAVDFQWQLSGRRRAKRTPRAITVEATAVTDSTGTEAAPVQLTAADI